MPRLSQLPKPKKKEVLSNLLKKIKFISSKTKTGTSNCKSFCPCYTMLLLMNILLSNN